jgi:hypothetical protein
LTTRCGWDELMATSDAWRLDVEWDVRAEMARADDRWGDQHDPPDLVWYSVLGEETGEVGHCLNEPWPLTLTPAQADALYGELVQVAAVAIRWMVRLRRREEAK